ncbi:MAG: glutamate racemase [Clostridia bacterium]|nr:glutamate racemase [Clostridia bacterium]
MTNNSYIGVFDSGIGGLTVVKSIIESMPNENIIYFGDTAHVPYGTRSPRQVTEYVLSDVKFINTFDIKAIVIACNTADSIARVKVEELYDLPVFGVVDPASKRAAEVTKNNKIGVIATNATIKSESYKAAIAKYNKDAEVFGVPCPLLVPLVENGRFHKGDIVIETVIKEYLDPLMEKGVDTLVLGCTHYPLLMEIIEGLYPSINIISSSGVAAETLKQNLEENGLISETESFDRKYFVSDDAEGFMRQAKVFMGDALGGEVEQVNLD